MLKYAGYQKACDIAFLIFIISWFITRHVFYMVICLSIWVHVPSEIPYGCYSLSNRTSIDWQTNTPPLLQHESESPIYQNLLHSFLNPDAPVCFNRTIHYTFLGLLLFLQGLTLVWFGMILRVAWRVMNGDGAEDSRSDDEEEEEVEGDSPVVASTTKEATVPFLQPVEEFVGVEALNLRRKTSPFIRKRKVSGHAGGISISGHSDKKELLGRIGCDKPS